MGTRPGTTIARQGLGGERPFEPNAAVSDPVARRSPGARAAPADGRSPDVAGAGTSAPAGRLPLVTRRFTAEEERQRFTQLRWLQRRVARQSVAAGWATIGGSGGGNLPLGRVAGDSWRELRALRQELAEVYFKLAVNIARAFANHPQEIDDLVGHASITLLRAIDLFDVSRGFRFSTYATRALRTELSRYVLRNRRRVSPIDPRSLTRHPDPAAEQRWRDGQAAFHALEEMLNRLEPREMVVVRSRFGMNECPGAETLQAVADRLGVSRERVRQLERQALAKLRQLADDPEYAERLTGGA